MENKYKIIVSYIQDLSIEIPNPETLITIRNTIPDYKMKVDIKSKPLKRKIIEVLTTLTYENPACRVIRLDRHPSRDIYFQDIFEGCLYRLPSLLIHQRF